MQSLNLTAQPLQGVVTAVSPAVGATNFTVRGLSPSTGYTVRLAVTIFGGASVTSEPVTVATLDGGNVGWGGSFLQQRPCLERTLGAFYRQGAFRSGKTGKFRENQKMFSSN